jgi:biotin synthase
MSIKTGGCPEDCGYCPQAAATTPVSKTRRSPMSAALSMPPRRKDAGATRFCMGPRGAAQARDLAPVLDMVTA